MLLVEDDHCIRPGPRAGLADEGFDVIEAGAGEEALVGSATPTARRTDQTCNVRTATCACDCADLLGAARVAREDGLLDR